jgi:hypothetical protein
MPSGSPAGSGPPDHSRALTRGEVTAILAKDVPLRERVFWHMLYETAARADELLLLDIDDLDMSNWCGTVTRKGGAKDIVAWQTGTARLLPRDAGGYRVRAHLRRAHWHTYWTGPRAAQPPRSGGCTRSSCTGATTSPARPSSTSPSQVPQHHDRDRNSLAAFKFRLSWNSRCVCGWLRRAWPSADSGGFDGQL